MRAAGDISRLGQGIMEGQRKVVGAVAVALRKGILTDTQLGEFVTLLPLPFTDAEPKVMLGNGKDAPTPALTPFWALLEPRRVK